MTSSSDVMGRPAGDEVQLRKRLSARDRIRELGDRINNTRTPTRPPWAWTNLNATDAVLLDQALDEFVEHYNRIHVAAIDEVIPACWRKHPAMAQELPVQFWAWWTSHIAFTATIPAAVDYYARTVPGFQARLPKLLGKGATNCRKGHHATSTDPELIDAISFPMVGAADQTAAARTPDNYCTAKTSAPWKDPADWRVVTREISEPRPRLCLFHRLHPPIPGALRVGTATSVAY